MLFRLTFVCQSKTQVFVFKFLLCHWLTTLTAVSPTSALLRAGSVHVCASWLPVSTAERRSSLSHFSAGYYLPKNQPLLPFLLRNFNDFYALLCFGNPRRCPSRYILARRRRNQCSEVSKQSYLYSCLCCSLLVCEGQVEPFLSTRSLRAQGLTLDDRKKGESSRRLNTCHQQSSHSAGIDELNMTGPLCFQLFLCGAWLTARRRLLSLCPAD